MYESYSILCTGSDPSNEDDQTNTTCDFTPVLPDSSSTGPNSVLPDSQGPTSSMPDTQKGIPSVIAESVIGSTIVLLFLVGTVLLAVVVNRRRKTKRSRGEDLDVSTNLINPLYVRGAGGKLHMIVFSKL